jgi:uncharacterized protein (TIGR02147 family)
VRAKKIVPKPDVFQYDDYRQFLADWIIFLKSGGEKTSARVASQAAGLSAWHLGKVISRRRNLTENVLQQIAPVLQLTKEQVTFLHRLCDLNDAKSAEEEELALGKARKFREFSYKQLDSIKVHQYLAAWYYPVIRELVNIPEFRLDPEWIRDNLKYKVSLSEIRNCLGFLTENGYIKIVDGKTTISDEIIKCGAGIHRIAMAKFHKEMLGLAVRSIYDTPREERKHISHTVCLSDKAVEKIRMLFDETLQKAEEIAQTSGAESTEAVYHINMIAFPLTNKRGSR